jgi:hypothetical protein
MSILTINQLVLPTASPVIPLAMNRAANVRNAIQLPVGMPKAKDKKVGKVNRNNLFFARSNIK